MAYYVGYALLVSLILFNIILIVGIVSEAFLLKNKGFINLNAPLWQSELVLKDESWIIQDKRKTMAIYYQVNHLPEKYNLQNLQTLSRSKVQFLETENAVFLRLVVKLPNRCNDLDLFLKEKRSEFVETMKQLLPRVILIPVSYDQLVRILSFF